MSPQAASQAIGLISNLLGPQAHAVMPAIMSALAQAPQHGGAGMMMQNRGAAQAAQRPPEGSWVCTSCSNVNYPLRTTCNGSSCGLLKEDVDGGPPLQATPAGAENPEGSWVCSGCKNVNFPLRTICNKKSCGLPRDQADSGPPAPPAKTWTDPTQKTGYVGSWTCRKCSNVNYPNRTVCNRRSCGEPRVDF